jgi:hypothetical protein
LSARLSAPSAWSARGYAAFERSGFILAQRALRKVEWSGIAVCDLASTPPAKNTPSTRRASSQNVYREHAHRGAQFGLNIRINPFSSPGSIQLPGRN